MARKLTILVGALLVSLLVAGAAFAYPQLQLDIAGADYYEYFGGELEQSTLTGDTMFTLYALLTPGNNAGLDQTYAISVAIYPAAEPDPTFGSVDIDGDTYAFETYGTPPPAVDATDLPGHSVFPTYYSQITFQFDPADTTSSYDVQTEEGDPDLTGTGSYYVAFDVDTSGLADGYTIHFDLYDVTDGSIKAPFSHDAGTRVPEPGTLVLLGIGMLGVAAYRRKLS